MTTYSNQDAVQITEADADYLAPSARELRARKERCRPHRYLPTKVGGAKCRKRGTMLRKMKDYSCLEEEGIGRTSWRR